MVGKKVKSLGTDKFTMVKMLGVGKKFNFFLYELFFAKWPDQKK